MKVPHRFAKRSLNPLDENGQEGCAWCGLPRGSHPEDGPNRAVRRGNKGVRVENLPARLHLATGGDRPRRRAEKEGDVSG